MLENFTENYVLVDDVFSATSHFSRVSSLSRTLTMRRFTSGSLGSCQTLFPLSTFVVREQSIGSEYSYFEYEGLFTVLPDELFPKDPCNSFAIGSMIKLSTKKTLSTTCKLSMTQPNRGSARRKTKTSLRIICIRKFLASKKDTAP